MSAGRFDVDDTGQFMIADFLVDTRGRAHPAEDPAGLLRSDLIVLSDALRSGSLDGVARLSRTRTARLADALDALLRAERRAP